MLIVRIELHSSRTGKSTEIGRMAITNDGTASDGSGDAPRGNYVVELMRRGRPSTVQRRARVEDFPRRSASVWALVRRALNAVL
jgi:hypothetical protein